MRSASMTEAIPSPPPEEVPFSADFQRSYITEGIRGEQLLIFESEFTLGSSDDLVARFRVMGNRSELEADVTAFPDAPLHLPGAVRRRHDRHQRHRHPARPAAAVTRASGAAAGARGHGGAARWRLSGRDRAAGERNQCADRRLQAHRRALAHAGRQPRPFAEDAACRAAQRRPRNRRAEGDADRRRNSNGHAEAARTLSAARAHRRAARQRRLPHACRAGAAAHGESDGKACSGQGGPA